MFQLIGGLIFGLVGALFWGLRNRHRRLTSDIQSVETLRWSRVQARQGCVNGLIVGLIAFFWYGGQDVIQHYILRFILYCNGHMPLRYAHFLDYAARLVFLQKVGGGYIFIHRLLLEHFAAMRNAEK